MSAKATLAAEAAAIVAEAVVAAEPSTVEAAAEISPAVAEDGGDPTLPALFAREPTFVSRAPVIFRPRNTRRCIISNFETLGHSSYRLESREPAVQEGSSPSEPATVQVHQPASSSFQQTMSSLDDADCHIEED